MSKDMPVVWKYEKFNGDLAIYAFCPNCGFYHNPSRLIEGTMKSGIVYQYFYCPMCGEYLYDAEAEESGFHVIWNKRNITELYNDVHYSQSGN